MDDAATYRQQSHPANSYHRGNGQTPGQQQVRLLQTLLRFCKEIALLIKLIVKKLDEGLQFFF
jgi:hypothetical protein